MRVTAIATTSATMPMSELTTTAGSAAPNASFSRALLPVCTVMSAPASKAATSEKTIIEPLSGT